jgi:hydroxymethylpyrimidine/phosphomethylpyrimidine kinase
VSPTPPRVLTIAGSDSGGGAGIQADLKTMTAHGVYGMSVVTAITAQNTCEVRAVHEVPPDVVAAQIDAVFDDIGVDAVKIGMLSSVAILEAVAAGLKRHRPRHVVLDPVMIAKSGDALLRDDAVAVLVEELLPLATVVTPNLPEAARLVGFAVQDEASRQRAAEVLAERGPSVLVKGGHGEGDELVDLLYDQGKLYRFTSKRLATSSTHGTGCTLSSAIACRLAQGNSLPQAVEGATLYLHGAIAAAFPLGSGHGPVHHLYGLVREA